MHCNMADYNSVSHEVDSVEQKPDEQSVSFTQVGLFISVTVSEFHIFTNDANGLKLINSFSTYCMELNN